MGLGHSNAVVPYKLKCAKLERVLGKYFNPRNEDDTNINAPFTFNGWLNDPNKYKDYTDKNKNHITAEKFTKGKHEIYAQNESQYESVGECDYCIFATSLEALKLFCKDFKLPITHMTKNDIVDQWY